MIDCNWDNPGADPYTGGVPAAVQRYNLPKHVAQELIERAAKGSPDSILTITKHGLKSFDGEFVNLRDMHFGKGKKCDGPVKRNKWADDHVEHALVYCSSLTCIAVPLVCHNVTLVDMVPPKEPEVFQSFETLPYWSVPESFGGTTTRTVPEPSSLLLAGLALLGVILGRR